MSRKSKTGRGREFIAKLADALEASPGSMGLEMDGRGSLKVHGCTRIAEYSCAKILLETRSGNIAVRGSGLACGFFNAGTVGITGRILSIELSEGE